MTILTISHIANIGCAMGMDYGFNMCEVILRQNEDLSHDKLDVHWGDFSQAREPARHFMLWARAYNLDFETTHTEIFRELDGDGVMLKPVDDIRYMFLTSLMGLF